MLEKTAEAFCLVIFIAKVFDSLYIPLTNEYDKQIQQILNCLPQGLVYLGEKDNGLFREDLYFRISTFIINLPPLRERKDDIILLTNEFLNKLSKKYNYDNITMDEQFMRALKAYSWRGNVRELEHAIERSVIIMSEGNKLLLEHLSDKIQEDYQDNTTTGLVQQAIERSENKQGLLELAEKMVIEHVLNTVDGNVSAAAEQLGVNRRTIYNKIQRDSNLKIIR